MNKTNGDKQAWQVVLTEEMGGITMQVSRLAVGQPRYSMGFGRVAADTGRLLPHIPVRRESTLSGVYLENEYALCVAELATRGEAFIRSAMQADLTAYLADREERDRRGASYGVQRTRVTGKTDRRKSKGASATEAGK